MGILLIAKDNIKKQKGNTFILFLLVALAVLMLYVGTSVLFNMDNVVENRHEAVNGTDFLLFSESTQSNEIMDFFGKQEEVTYLEKEEAIFLTSARYYIETKKEDADEIGFLFLNKEAERKLSVIQLIDGGEEWKENSIILPYYMKVGMGYKTGEILNIEINKKYYAFEIYGFTEDIMFATTSNVPVEKGFISDQLFKKISKELGSSGYSYRVELKKDIEIGRAHV